MRAEQINSVYLPRNPKASPLHGLLQDHFDECEHVYDDGFAIGRKLLMFLLSYYNGIPFLLTILAFAPVALYL